VFGRLAGVAAAAFSKGHAQVAGGAAALAADDRRMDGLMASEGKESTERIRQELKKVMWEKVGIYRNEPDMSLAVGAVHDLQRRYGNVRVGAKNKMFNYALLEAIELKNLLDLAEVISKCALIRQESRGAHSRTDYPKRDDADWLKHSLAWQRAGRTEITYEPVRITNWEPKERTY
jgi:succinate dehydrogenase / fumarate reductase flavoprotein subunit